MHRLLNTNVFQISVFRFDLTFNLRWLAAICTVPVSENSLIDFILIDFIIIIIMLVIKCRALGMLGKHSTTELHSQSFALKSLNHFGKYWTFQAERSQSHHYMGKWWVESYPHQSLAEFSHSLTGGTHSRPVLIWSLLVSCMLISPFIDLHTAITPDTQAPHSDDIPHLHSWLLAYEVSPFSPCPPDQVLLS